MEPSATLRWKQTQICIVFSYPILQGTPWTGEMFLGTTGRYPQTRDLGDLNHPLIPLKSGWIPFSHISNSTWDFCQVRAP